MADTETGAELELQDIQKQISAFLNNLDDIDITKDEEIPKDNLVDNLEMRSSQQKITVGKNTTLRITKMSLIPDPSIDDDIELQNSLREHLSACREGEETEAPTSSQLTCESMDLTLGTDTTSIHSSQLELASNQPFTLADSILQTALPNEKKLSKVLSFQDLNSFVELSAPTRPRKNSFLSRLTDDIKSKSLELTPKKERSFTILEQTHFQRHKWEDFPQDSTSNPLFHACLQKTKLYQIEIGSSKAQKLDPDRLQSLEAPEAYQFKYADIFSGHKTHVNIIGRSQDDAIFISIVPREFQAEKNSVVFVLLRTKTKDSLLEINFQHPVNLIKLNSQTLTLLKQYYPALKKFKFTVISSEKFILDLLVLEKKLIVPKKVKFGIISYNEGQNEDEMFGNQLTPQLSEFLDFLLTKTTLKGFNGFAAGLDTKFDETGLYSYYEIFRGFELMAHVAALLPESGGQQIPRKRHIGNDTVIVIFDESKTGFDPTMITSHFCHVFIVIKPISPSQYQINVASKEGVPVFGPFLTHLPVYVKGLLLKDFILTKIINGSKAANEAPAISQPLLRARKDLIFDLNQKYKKKKN